MLLPIFQDDNKNFMLMQTSWASSLNPVIQSALSNGNIVKNIKLVSGTNVINHLLGRAPQGYFPVRFQSSATSFYDTQSTNSQAILTLILVAAGSATVDLFIF